MIDWQILLEYVKVILAFPVTTLICFLTFILLYRADVSRLLSRIAKMSFSGASVEMTSQRQLSKSDDDENAETAPEPTSSDIEAVSKLTDFITEFDGIDNGLKAKIETLLLSERTNSYLWEYRYLNRFLVYNSQRVLDWLIERDKPATERLYDSVWMQAIPEPNERRAILNALKTHHIIFTDDTSGIVTVTPKGVEYAEFRGEIPEPTE